MPEFDKETQKALFKEAINEWLDKQASDFGKWAVKRLEH